jgi:hypothetical protein
LLFAIINAQKGAVKKLQFLKTVRITDSLGPVKQVGKQSLPVYCMVIRPGIQTQVTVAELSAYFMSHGAYSLL